MKQNLGIRYFSQDKLLTSCDPGFYDGSAGVFLFCVLKYDALSPKQQLWLLHTLLVISWSSEYL